MVEMINVSYKPDLVSSIVKIPADNIKYIHASYVSYMGLIIDRGPTYIHSDPAFLYRLAVD